MNNKLNLIRTLAVVAGLGFSSLAMATTTTIPYLYVYSIPGSVGAAGAMTATLTSYENGPNSQVGLPSGLPYSGSQPVVVSNGTTSGSVQANLTYHITLGSVSSNCELQVSSPQIGLPASSPNGQVTLLSDSGGQGLCTTFLQKVDSVNPQDGDQVINLNWKA